jgi:murein DD-endopeptidase MepM/ murein hydrolase activator NlpD
MRWLTEDPVKDGENWFLYCQNDPVNYIDLLGLDVNEGDAKDFWENRQDTWCYPLESEATEDPTTSDNFFESNRARGERSHAGVDFHAPVGTDVIAMTSGTVTEVNKNFYSGTDAVAIKNSDGTIARYTEISVSVNVNDTVAKGQVIGEVIQNQDKNPQSMLHLEVYMGTEEGALIEKGNKTYDYVPDKNYSRRSDLLDPTGAKDLKIYNKNEENKS